MGAAIRIHDISKKYSVAALKPRNDTLKDEIGAGVRAMLAPRRETTEQDFWALRNVSFDVGQGEIVGVIGRNGAGKSTLLKLLSRISEPTTGRIEIRGRVGSLLEVGTGFDRELTGRENTYLNGAILGMTKREIDRKFDEIVAFAEIEAFIDTPVKRYSSGMYTRLAFAVAAHLEPEVLIIDEVLAVGDAKFQARCLGKIGEVARGGRTVLFVSHNMAAVTRFCPRVVWLERGQLHEDGPSDEVVSRYMAEGGSGGGVVEYDAASAPGSDLIRLSSIRTRNAAGETTDTIGTDQPLTVEVEYETLRRTSGLRIGVTLLGSEGEVVLSTKDLDVHPSDYEREPGRYVSAVEIPPNLLNIGQFSITVGSDLPMVQGNFKVERALGFTVELSGDSVGGHVLDGRAGLLRVRMPWSIKRVG